MPPFLPHARRRLLGFSVSIAALAGAAGAAAQASAPREGGPPDGHRGPPAEALAACKTLAAGKACAFKLGERSLSGRCWAPEGRPLACRPEGAPPPGGAPGGAGGKP
jgi:hypothetical protein